MRRRAAMISLALTAVAATVGGGFATPNPASATGETEQGRITTGIGSFELAEAAPCTPSTDTSTGNIGEWASEGPTVCFPKPAGVTGWDLDWEFTRGCSGYWYLVAGYASGDCLFVEDEGDHVKVWGSLGITDMPFTLTWEHA